MTEAVVTAVVAALGAGAALNNKLHSRINSVHDRIGALDRRIDALQLDVANDYVKKTELANLLARMEDHMVRIENKLDQLAFNNSNQ